MGLAVPIVTTVGTVAGIAAQQRAANQQREALARQAAQSQLEFELQIGQAELARQAAQQRGALESQVAQQEARLAGEVIKQQRLSDALQVESAKASIAQQSYANLVSRYSGLTQALQMQSQGSALRQQAAQSLNAAATGQLSASGLRSQANTQMVEALNTEAQPYNQAAQGLTALGEAMLQSREGDATQSILRGVTSNEGAVQRVARQSDVTEAIRGGIQAGQQGANLQRALAQRGYLQADIQGQEADRALRAAGYLDQDVGALDESAALQARATNFQDMIGSGILGYNRELVGVQEVLNNLKNQQSEQDLGVGLERNILAIQQRNLANASQLEALSGQAAAQYNNQLSAIAANRASINNPNYLASLVNVGTAWAPYAMQQGWFSPQAPSAPSLMGGGGWSPYVDVRPSNSNVLYG